MRKIAEGRLAFIEASRGALRAAGQAFLGQIGHFLGAGREVSGDVVCCPPLACGRGIRCGVGESSQQGAPFGRGRRIGA